MVKLMVVLVLFSAVSTLAAEAGKEPLISEAEYKELGNLIKTYTRTSDPDTRKDIDRMRYEFEKRIKYGYLELSLSEFKEREQEAVKLYTTLKPFVVIGQHSSYTVNGGVGYLLYQSFRKWLGAAESCDDFLARFQYGQQKKILATRDGLNPQVFVQGIYDFWKAVDSGEQKDKYAMYLKIVAVYPKDKGLKSLGDQLREELGPAAATPTPPPPVKGKK